MDNPEDVPPISLRPVSQEAFSQVIFPDIQHYYKPKNDIKCSFEKRTQFEAGSKDWVGLFKVGWTTTNEYYTWVFVPRNENHVLFKGYYLPQENEEHYQFCYVDHNGEVRGISLPFQFRSDASEYESDIFLVTREDEIEKINEEKIMLKKENETQAELIQILQAEIREISQKKEAQHKDMDVQLKNCQEENEKLQMKLSCQESELKEYRSKAQDSCIAMEQMRTQLEKCEEEKKSFQSATTDKQQAVENLNGVLEKCRNELTTLKTELETQMCALETQKKLTADLQNKLAEEKMKTQDLESNFTDSSIRLEIAEENLSTVKQKLSLQQIENSAKNEEIKKLQLAVAPLQAEVDKLKDARKENLKVIENEKKMNANLQDSLNKQCKKSLETENTVSQLQAELKSTQNQKTILEQRLALLELEYKNKSEENDSLRSTIELREEELNDLHASNERKSREIDELKSEVTQLRLSQAFSPSLQPPGLIFNNPYGETPANVSGQDESHSFSGGSLGQEERWLPSLQCPQCDAEFPGDKQQVYEDHVMCHNLDDC